MELDKLEAHARTLADMAWMHAEEGEPRFTAQQLAITVQGFTDELLAALRAMQQALATSSDPGAPPSPAP